MSKTAALFRSPEDAAASAARLAALGWSVALAPAAAPAPLPVLSPLGPFAGIVASSAKAFEYADAQVLHALRGAPVHVVGEKTARAAIRCGFASQPAARDAAELARRIVAGFAPPARFVYLAGRDRKSDLERALAEAGLAVETLETYEMRAREAWSREEAEGVGRADAALHYSRRSAKLACALATRAGLRERWRALIHVGLSADALEPLEATAARLIVAAEPNEAAMFAALVKLA